VPLGARLRGRAALAGDAPGVDAGGDLAVLLARRQAASRTVGIVEVELRVSAVEPLAAVQRIAEDGRGDAEESDEQDDFLHGSPSLVGNRLAGDLPHP